MPGPIVLARDANRFPLLVTLQRGHFYIVPGIPVFVGDVKGPSMMTVSNLVDFMVLPD